MKNSIRHFPSEALVRQKLVASIVILAGCGWLGYQGLRDFHLLSRSTDPVQTVASAVASQGTSLVLTQVLELSMFGKAPATPTPAPARDRIPESRLNLTLKGVFASDNPELTGALIAEAGGKGKYYRIGDEIPGGAKLEEVHGDFVSIKRGDALELLKLVAVEKTGSRESHARSASREPPPPVVQNNSDSNRRQARVKNLRDRLKSLREQQH